jgi:AcrR family transcriptional regulator
VFVWDGVTIHETASPEHDVCAARKEAIVFRKDGPVATLTRTHLIEEALGLVDELGASALSMRRLAHRVDRKASSLYNHVRNRADLVEAIRAHVVADIDTSAFDSERWDVALEAWARSYLMAFARHPAVIDLLATTPIRDASTLVMYNTVIDALRRAGWPRTEVVAVMRTVEAHILGSALDLAAPQDLLSQAATPSHLSTLRESVAPSLSQDFSAAAAFEIGITALLEGLRRRHETVRS